MYNKNGFVLVFVNLNFKQSKSVCFSSVIDNRDVLFYFYLFFPYKEGFQFNYFMWKFSRLQYSATLINIMYECIDVLKNSLMSLTTRWKKI